MDSSLHKDMLSILSATSEVIFEAGGKMNETEYFATFVSNISSILKLYFGIKNHQYHP